MEIVGHMHDYQRINNIKRCCLQNVQFVYDGLVNASYANIEPIAVMVIKNYPEEKRMHCYNHMVLIDVITEKLIEPSYEVGSIKDTQYYVSFSVLLKATMGVLYLTPEEKTTLLKNHIDFCNFAERMKKGEFIITDKDIYEKQADYVEEKIIAK
jgi:hypothetical protein